MSIILANNGDVVITNNNGNALILSMSEAKELYQTLKERYDCGSEESDGV